MSDRVLYRGRMVTPRAKLIYEALGAGLTQAECAKRFGVAVGSMSGYVARARSMGIDARRRQTRVIVAVSTQAGTAGEVYEMRGAAQVEALGFSYSAAWKYAKQQAEKFGFKWFFKGEV